MNDRSFQSLKQTFQEDDKFTTYGINSVLEHKAILVCHFQAGEDLNVFDLK
jgi:hypothetical protein